MSIGAKGVVSVVANILPKETHDMTHHYLNGKTKEALDLQLKYLELINSLFIETNPIPVKTALNLMGKKVGNLRLPLVDMEETNLYILETEMKKAELI